MLLKWTANAHHDLRRLHDFLSAVNPPVATEVIGQLLDATAHLRIHPQIGGRLEEFAPRDVRRIVSGDYEIRYEVAEIVIFILRLWHTRENR